MENTGWASLLIGTLPLAKYLSLLPLTSSGGELSVKKSNVQTRFCKLHDVLIDRWSRTLWQLSSMFRLFKSSSFKDPKRKIILAALDKEPSRQEPLLLGRYNLS